MAELSTLARPYAEAAYQLAKQSNTLPQWAESLALVAAVANDSDMAATQSNPGLTADAKSSFFLSVAGDRLFEPVRNFVRVLIQSGRIDLAGEIKAMFLVLKDQSEGVLQAVIKSAFPMSDAQLADLRSALSKRFGRDVQAAVAVDPSLIGGALVTVGDTVIDASVRGSLQKLQAALV